MMIGLSGDRELFVLHREGGEVAASLYGNQGLKPAARAFGLVHERAVQYLAQAPVMVFSAGVSSDLRTSALHLQFRLHTQCRDGVKLRDMMRDLGYPLPLRRLSPSALFPNHAVAIDWLKRSPPTLLGRIIPVKSGKQRKWLSALSKLCASFAFRRAGLSQAMFDWFAEQAALNELTDLGDMADFAIAASRDIAGATFNIDWAWPRATEEAALWHDKLTCEQMLRGTPFSRESIIDAGDHPDTMDAMGLQFVALRTPGDIAQEGSHMRHCVASYIPRVINGDCHIVSLRREGERCATLELSKTWAVTQLKRRFNKTPSTLEDSASRFYAELAKARAREETDRRRGR